jgi:8-oxo-dGTP diphosphatase
MKEIVVSGPVIIECGKLLVSKDAKDDFYKIPGGTVKFGEELEDACKREVKQETNADIEILRPLPPKVLYKNPQTGEEMVIVLINYEAKVKNKDELKPNREDIKEIKWLNIKEIKEGKHIVSPNVKSLIDKGDIE